MELPEGALAHAPTQPDFNLNLSALMRGGIVAATPVAAAASAAVGLDDSTADEDDEEGDSEVISRVRQAVFFVPSSLHGWAPMPSPSRAGVFCKQPFADPMFVCEQPYFGVAFDLFSIGATLYCVVTGKLLYRTPHPADASFNVVWRTECLEVMEQLGLGVFAPGALAAGPDATAMTTTTHTGVAALPASSSTPSLHSTIGSGASSSSSSGGSSIGRDRSTVPGLNAVKLRGHLQQISSTRLSQGLPGLSEPLIDLLCHLLHIRPATRPINALAILQHPWFQLAAGGQAQAAQQQQQHFRSGSVSLPASALVSISSTSAPSASSAAAAATTKSSSRSYSTAVSAVPPGSSSSGGGSSAAAPSPSSSMMDME